MDLFLTSPGFEAALAAEISGGATRTVAPGVVVADEAAFADYVFARQILPGIEEIRAPSVTKLASKVVDSVFGVLLERQAPFCLQCFGRDDPDAPTGPPLLSSRAALIEKRVLEVLKDRRKKLAKLETDDASQFRVQVLLVESEHLCVSAKAPMRAPDGHLWPAPFAAGRAPIDEDRSAPSSAYRKLLEALAWIDGDILRGQRVVDLGASPGGWSHVALKKGAEVLAVDKAALDSGVAAHPHLRHEKKDAFKLAVEDPPVDWLLSDLISTPERGLELLSRWAKPRWFRRAIFHLKFKGSESYGAVSEGLELLRSSGYRARAKHLVHDKNEVTLLATEAAA